MERTPTTNRHKHIAELGDTPDPEAMRPVRRARRRLVRTHYLLTAFLFERQADASFGALREQCEMGLSSKCTSGAARFIPRFFSVKTDWQQGLRV